MQGVCLKFTTLAWISVSTCILPRWAFVWKSLHLHELMITIIVWIRRHFGAGLSWTPVLFGPRAASGVWKHAYAYRYDSRRSATRVGGGLTSSGSLPAGLSRWLVAAGSNFALHRDSCTPLSHKAKNKNYWMHELLNASAVSFNFTTLARISVSTNYWMQAP